MGRTAKPNGELVRRLREAKAWDQQALANKSDRSLRTIQNIESGHYCRRSVLAEIAKALGVEYIALVIDDETPALLKDPFVINIKLSFPFDQFDQCDQLNEYISSFLNIVSAQYPINVISVSRGSVIVSIEMEAEDVALLARAILMHKFDDSDVESIHFVNFDTIDGGPRSNSYSGDDGTLRNVWFAGFDAPLSAQILVWKMREYLWMPQPRRPKV